MARNLPLLLLGLAALTAGCGRRTNDAPTPPPSDAGAMLDEFVNVRLAEAVEITADETLAVTGSIVAATDVSIAGKIGGKVRFIGADEGQRVGRGAVLVELDSDAARAQLNQAVGALQSARANYNKAVLNQDLSQAQSDAAVTSARAQLAAAEAGLTQAIEAEKLARAQSSDEGANITQARTSLETARARLAQARETLTITRQETQGNLTSAEQTLAQSEAALRSARARETQARSALSLTDSQTATALEAARQTQISAQQQVSMMEEGTRSQDVAAARSRRDAAQAQVTLAQSTFDRTKYLYDNGAVSLAQLDSAETGLTAAREGLRQAESMLSMATEGPRRQEVEIARSQLRSADEQLRGAERGRTEQLNQATENVSQAVNAVAAAEADVAKAEAAVNTAKVALGMVAIREQDVYAAENTHEAAQAALRLAEAGVSNVEIARQEVQRARTAVDAARGALRQALAGRVAPRINREDIANLAGMVRSAEASVASARVNLRDHTIIAPLAGGIAEQLVEVGEVIAPGQMLYRLVADHLVEFKAVVPEEKIRFVTVGSPVTVAVDAVPGQTFVGTVLEVLPAADQRSRTFPVTIGVDNAGRTLREGMFARGTIVVEQGRTALRVPVEAVVHRDLPASEAGGEPAGGDYVVAMVGTNLARPVPVEIGTTRDAMVEILSGELKPGDRVVVEGALEITAEQQVRVLQ